MKFALLGTWHTGGRNVPAVLIGDFGDGSDAVDADGETRLKPCRPSMSSCDLCNDNAFSFDKDDGDDNDDVVVVVVIVK